MLQAHGRQQLRRRLRPTFPGRRAVVWAHPQPVSGGDENRRQSRSRPGGRRSGRGSICRVRVPCPACRGQYLRVLWPKSRELLRGWSGSGGRRGSLHRGSVRSSIPPLVLVTSDGARTNATAFTQGGRTAKDESERSRKKPAKLTSGAKFPRQLLQVIAREPTQRVRPHSCGALIQSLDRKSTR